MSRAVSKERLTQMLFEADGWRFDLCERSLGSGRRRRRFDMFGIADAFAFKLSRLALIQITDYTNWAVHAKSAEAWAERDHNSDNPWLTGLRSLWLIAWKPKSNEYKYMVWRESGVSCLHRKIFHPPPEESCKSESSASRSKGS